MNFLRREIHTSKVTQELFFAIIYTEINISTSPTDLVLLVLRYLPG